MSKPALFSVKRGELSLSGPILTQLLRAVLDKGVPFRFQAKGYSMFPFIRDGDVVTVSPLSANSYRVGNVMAFVNPVNGNLVVHRIVGKKGDSFLVKGDNVPATDGIIPKANILGYVTKVERKGRRVFLGLGPERLLIALLARKRLISPLMLRLQKLARLTIRR